MPWTCLPSRVSDVTVCSLVIFTVFILWQIFLNLDRELTFFSPIVIEVDPIVSRGPVVLHIGIVHLVR